MNKIQRDIRAKILQELAEHPIRSMHGFTKENVTRRLIVPKLETYCDLFDEDVTLELWTVFDETPEDGSAHIVFYDPQTGMFGLGLHKEGDRHVCLGRCGSFLDTLEQM
ncbi:MAG: hypothetical protein ACYSTF_02395 [Planctomycetota bacterium]